MIAVRPASPSDLDSVLALWGGATEAGDRIDRPALDRLLAGEPDALLVATEGGRLLGTVVVERDGGRGQLSRLVIDPTSRRQGVARSLLQAAERRLRALGADRAEAAVDPTSQALWQGARYAPAEDGGPWVKPLV